MKGETSEFQGERLLRVRKSVCGVKFQSMYDLVESFEKEGVGEGWWGVGGEWEGCSVRGGGNKSEQSLLSVWELCDFDNLNYFSVT